VSADLFPEGLLAAAYVLLPGCGLCLATGIAVDRSIFTFLALAFGLGFGGVGLVCLLLALTGLMGPTSLSVAWIVGTSICLVIAQRRGAPRRYLRGWREQVIGDPLAAGSAALVVVGVAIARSIVDPVTAIGPTVLRYWADALEIADAGRIPEGTLQWGTVLEPATSKVVLNAFNAGASMFLGRDVVGSQAALLGVVTVGLVLVAIAMFSEMGIPRLAPLGALLLFVNDVFPHDLTRDLARNLAENWGRLGAFSAVLAWILAVPLGSPYGGSERNRGSPARVPLLIVSGILLGVTAGTHLVAASFGVAAIAALTVASMILTRPIRPLLRATGAVAGVALLIGGGVLALAPGDLGFTGAVGADPYRRLRSELGLPASFDPTYFIATHDLDGAQDRGSDDVGDVVEMFAYKAGGHNVHFVKEGQERPPLALALPSIVAVVLVVAVLIAGPVAHRVVALSSVILAATLLAVGIAFALRYDVFVLESFGNRRLFSYATVAYLLVLLAAGESVLTRFRTVAPVVATIVVVLGAAILIPSSDRPEIVDESGFEQLALVRWVGHHVPCEGRILADRRSLGTFEAIAGRVGVLEGMGPHIRPAVLELAIGEIFRARDFFTSPEDGLPYLHERAVAAVVVASPGVRSALLGYRITPPRPQRLERVPFLRQAFRNAAGTVYLVEGFRPDPSSPRVAGRPGYPCHAP
jgi:hypothetical protein